MVGVMEMIRNEQADGVSEIINRYLREEAIRQSEVADMEILEAVKLLQSYGCRSPWDWKRLSDKVLELEGEL